jgi:hypothetical protein
MAGSGINLEYHGLIDCPAIESMLASLRSMKAYQDLTTLIRKRTYSLLVECTENILKHSALKSTADDDKMPHVRLTETDDRIIIRAGNPVTEDKQIRLMQKIDNVNGRDSAELRRMHEERINTGYDKGENGAGLGFICMALKSGNKLAYSFRPLADGFVFFELEVSLNK